METDYDAVIIGAGPAGSAAAILLRQAGWSVTLVEKQCYPRRKVCGECIAAPNLELLDALGIGNAVDGLAGPPLQRFALLSGSHSLVAALPASQSSRRWGRPLRREHLDLQLLNRAAELGAVVWQPWNLMKTEGHAGDWRCTVRSVTDGSTAVLTSPVLIIATGSWDKALQQSSPRHRSGDLLAFKASFRHASLEEGLLPVLAFPGGYGGMVMCDDGLTTVACCIRRDRLAWCRSQRTGTQAGDAVEHYLKTSCAGVRHALTMADREGSWLGIGPIRPGIRLNPGNDGIFLVGNAAGEAHPIIGEGISMALQSAWLLCGLLITEGRTIFNASRQQIIQVIYANRWRRHFSRRIYLAALFAHLAMRPQLARGLLPLLRRYPELLTHAARLCGKTHAAVSADPLQKMFAHISPSAGERIANDNA